MGGERGGEEGGVEGGVWKESEDEEEGLEGGEQAGHLQLGCQSAALGRPEHLKCTQALQSEH